MWMTEAAGSRKKYEKVSYYKDFAMLEKERTISTPVPFPHPTIRMPWPALLRAMQLGKHVYTQKPLTHDIYEARILTEAAKKYKVVTQMGNQGAPVMA